MELALEQALKKSGVNQRTVTQAKGSRRSIMRSHGFRKFAITMMDKANVKDTHRRYLTGHAQVGQDASYVLPYYTLTFYHNYAYLCLRWFNIF